jgi:hypothetical protein
MQGATGIYDSLCNSICGSICDSQAQPGWQGMAGGCYLCVMAVGCCQASRLAGSVQQIWKVLMGGDSMHSAVTCQAEHRLEHSAWGHDAAAKAERKGQTHFQLGQVQQAPYMQVMQVDSSSTQVDD